MSSQQARIESLDALRGFALLGILLVNVEVFSGWGFLGAEGRESLTWAEFDEPLLHYLKIVAHDKFYSLFSLLFGYSFVMIATRKGAGYHLRRMVGLGLLGLAHALLLWPWDILLLYALVGLLLTPFLRAPVSVLLLSAATLLVLVGTSRFWWPMDPTWNQQWLALLGDSVPVMANGHYRELLSLHRELLPANALDRLESLRPLRVMTLFLLGAAAARLGLADPRARQGGKLAIIAAVTLIPGVYLAYLEQALADTGEGARFILAETLAGPLMAMAYASILMLWWNRGGWLARGICRMLAPAGRMALTNYLGQSAVMVPVFYGFGLGLFADVSLARLQLLALALFGAQLVASALWLRYFRQGPMEWLWRFQIQGRPPALLR